MAAGHQHLLFHANGPGSEKQHLPFFKLKHVYIELIRGVFETYEFEAPFRSKPP